MLISAVMLLMLIAPGPPSDQWAATAQENPGQDQGQASEAEPTSIYPLDIELEPLGTPRLGESNVVRVTVTANRWNGDASFEVRVSEGLFLLTAPPASLPMDPGNPQKFDLDIRLLTNGTHSLDVSASQDLSGADAGQSISQRDRRLYVIVDGAQPGKFHVDYIPDTPYATQVQPLEGAVPSPLGNDTGVAPPPLDLGPLNLKPLPPDLPPFKEAPVPLPVDEGIGILSAGASEASPAVGTDYSGNNRNLDVRGSPLTATPAASKYGYGFQFSGTTDEYLQSSNPGLGSSGDLSIFVAFTADDTANSRRLFGADCGHQCSQYIFDVENGQWKWRQKSGSNPEATHTIGPALIGFHTLTVRRDDTAKTVTFKIDDQLQTTYSYSGAVTTNFNEFVIATLRSGTTNWWWDGNVYEFRIWNSLVSQTILDEMATTGTSTWKTTAQGTESGLFWMATLDLISLESGPAIPTDFSGSGRNLQVVGAPGTGVSPHAKYGVGYRFSGASNDHLRSTDSALGSSGDLSIFAAFTADDTVQSRRLFAVDCGAFCSQYVFDVSAGQWIWRQRAGTTESAYTLGTANTGFHTLWVQRDDAGKTVTLNIDGSVNTFQYTGAITTNFNEFIIGTLRSGTTNWWWDGDLYEFRVWNRVVPQSALDAMATRSNAAYQDSAEGTERGLYWMGSLDGTGIEFFRVATCWNYIDNLNPLTYQPQRWARVEVYDQDANGAQQLLTFGQTGNNGCYLSDEIARADDEGGRVDVFLRFVSCNNVACVTASDGTVYNGYTWPPREVDANENPQQWPTYQVGTDNDWAWRMFQYANNAYTYANLFGGYAPGSGANQLPRVTVEIPHSCASAGAPACYGGIPIIDPGPEEIWVADTTIRMDSLAHEYGHYAMDRSYDQPLPGPGIAHQRCQDNQDLGLAWREGFADFFGANADWHGTRISPALPGTTGDRLYNGADIETVKCAGESGPDDEWRVAMALWDLWDGNPPDGVDQYSNSLSFLHDHIRACDDATYADFYAGTGPVYSPSCNWPTTGDQRCRIATASWQNDIDFQSPPTGLVTSQTSFAWAREEIQLTGFYSDLEKCPGSMTFRLSADSQCTDSDPLAGTATQSSYGTSMSVAFDTNTFSDRNGYWVCARASDSMTTSAMDRSDAQVGVDNTPPPTSAQRTCLFAGSNDWCRDQADVTLIVGTDATSGLASSSCTIGGASVACNQVTRVSGGGARTARAQGIDAAGNLGAAEVAVNIDGTAPSVSVSVPSTATLSWTITWSATDSTSGLTGALSLRETTPTGATATVCTQSVASGSSSTNGQCTRTSTQAPVPGQYCYVATITDMAGNTGTSPSRCVTKV